MREILYIANMRLPSERAHSVHVAEMCAALAGLAKVFLLVPKRHTDVKTEDVYDFYGVPKIFEIIRLKSWDAFQIKIIPKRLAYYLHAFTFYFSVIKEVKKHPDALILSRDFYSAYRLAKMGKKVVFEVHDLPSLRRRKMLKAIPKIITTNEFKKKQLINNFSIEESKILIASNAVDLNKFQISSGGGGQLRREMGWPRDKKIALYTGSLFAWKGVHTLARAAKFLPEDIIIVIVGGDEKSKEDFRQFLSNEKISEKVFLLPHRPHKDIPALLASADVLVVPTSAKEQMGREETSPIKAFEYLAAQKIIVVSDVPSSREVFNEKMALFFKPDDAEDCARGIRHALTINVSEMINAQNQFIRNHTWQARAQKILDFMSN